MEKKDTEENSAKQIPREKKIVCGILCSKTTSNVCQISSIRAVKNFCYIFLAPYCNFSVDTDKMRVPIIP